MLPIVTPAEMAEADRRTIAAGTPESALVERAGRAVALAARQELGGSYGRRAVVLCGGGNNGADGRVAARVLRTFGVRVDVFAVGREPGLDRSRAARGFARADLVIDAMFGTGFCGDLDGDAAWCADALATGGAPVLAVDIPSGVDGRTGHVATHAVCARSTLCFQALKPGLLFEPGRAHAGSVGVVDIGVAVVPRVYAVDLADVRVPTRPPDAHKWSRAVVIVGGSGGMAGAPMLAARAAARACAGMVVAVLPAPGARRAPASEIVVRELASDPAGGFAAEAAVTARREIGRFAAGVIGPGLGRALGSDAFAARVIAEAPIPLVIDADALNVLADDRAALDVRYAAGLPLAILTPHDGEFARLAGRPVGDDRIAAAVALATERRCIVLLKGPATVVAAPDGRAVVTLTGGASLATAGTGDVLSGVIAALLTAGLAPFEAAWQAAVVHGAAADRSPFGDGTIASDVIDALPLALLDREQPRSQDARHHPGPRRDDARSGRDLRR